jgi:hypothetical protein
MVMRRALSALATAGLLASGLGLVGVAPHASAQAEGIDKPVVLVHDAVVVEPDAGTARLVFPVSVANSKGPITLRYSTAIEEGSPADTAEASDFVAVPETEVTLTPVLNTGADPWLYWDLFPNASVNSPLVVEVRADAATAADDPLETFTLALEAVSDVHLVREEAKGAIADADASQQTMAHCAADPAGTLVVVGVSNVAGQSSLAVSRLPGSRGLEVTYTAPGQAPSALACGDPSVDDVDTIEVRILGTGPWALTLDQSQGRFAPGKTEDLDLFSRPSASPGSLPPEASTTPPTVHQDEEPSVGLGEDDVPEIEFDLHLPLGTRGGGIQDQPPPAITLAVIGTGGPDHVVAGQVSCPHDTRGPTCRDHKLNLNAGADADPDVLIAYGEANETHTTSPSGFHTGAHLAALRLEGRGGNDVLSAAGGAGTGGPVAPLAASGLTFGNPVVLEGGDGNDVLVGGKAADTLRGGPGADRLEGGGNLSKPGPTFAPEHLEGGPGDDVLDEGADVTPVTLIGGGPGHDIVDYAKRLRKVIAQPGPNHPENAPPPHDDGEANEGDNVATDVEEVRLPAFDVDTGVGAGGVRWVGELPAPVGCAKVGTSASLGGQDNTGPCPLVVDAVNGVGIAVGGRSFNGAVQINPGVFFYDLNNPKDIDGLDDVASLDSYDCVQVVRSDVDSDNRAEGVANCGVFSYATVDSARRQLYAPAFSPGPVGSSSANCALVRFDYSVLRAPTTGWVRYSGCWRPRSQNAYLAGLADPPGPKPLIHLALAWDEALDGLYAAGAFWEDSKTRLGPRQQLNSGARWGSDFPFENLGQPLIVRQVKAGPDDPATPDVEMGAYSWDLDLRFAGCGRRVTHAPGDPMLRAFVARVGNDLLSYCWDAKAGSGAARSSFGDQGYVVRIPLDGEHRPRRLDPDKALDSDGDQVFDNYRFTRTPTLPGYLDVVTDPGDQKVVLVTDGSVNGNAAWVFDPKRDRFVGVSSGGAVTQPPGGTAVGVDPVRGRAYMTTQDGLLVVPSRARPLPAGTVYPVGINVKGETDFANTRTIGVLPASATRPARLFLPLNIPDQRALEDGRCCLSSEKGARYVMVEDSSPDPITLTPDPDANTAQVEEEEGVTEVRASGIGLASGAHVVVTGGVTRTVNQADPGCRYEVGVVVGDSSIASNGRPERGEQGPIQLGFAASTPPLATPFPPLGNDGCVADQVLTPGHRETFLATTSGEAGSGSVARGAPLAFGPSDVTASDVKKRGSCESATLHGATASRWAPLPQEAKDDPGFQQFQAGVDEGYESGFASGYRQGCGSAWDVATGQGEAAAPPEHADRDPRTGLPDPRAGTTGRDGKGFPAKAATCTDFGAGLDQRAEGAGPLGGSARCEHAATTATATATAPGLLLTGPTPVGVASTASSVRSFRDPALGQVTLASAVARGVVVGELAIREVRALALARAKGRTGSAVVDLQRRWCGITVAGQAPVVEPVLSAEDPDPWRGSTQDKHGCIDPDNPDNDEFVESLNRQLQGKLRLSVPGANGTGRGEASPGGFQAVVTKHPDQRGGDLVVNDDDTHAVAALEAIVYNDGAEGRNRVVVQLASVHAEARYGITVVPAFGGLGSYEPPTTTTDGAPSSEPVSGGGWPGAEELVEEPELFEIALAGADLPLAELAGGNPIGRFLKTLPEAVGDVLRLLIQHPREFALLMLVFALLATPPYLAYRRRQFAGLMAG